MDGGYGQSDGPGMGLDAIVGLTMKIGNLADSMDAQRRREEQHRRALIPTDWPLVAVATCDSNGLAALDLGMPPEGTVWLLRRLYVGGVKRTDTADGTADLFVTASAALAILTTTPASSIADSALSLPSQAFYTNRQVPVHPPERLVVVVSGGTTGQNYLASAMVESYSERAMHEVYAL